MSSEATLNLINEAVNESMKRVAKESYDIGYNQAIEDVLKEIQWSRITYDEKKKLMEKSRSLKLKSSQDESVK